MLKDKIKLLKIQMNFTKLNEFSINLKIIILQ